jgi:hypothetical protein
MKIEKPSRYSTFSAFYLFIIIQLFLIMLLLKNNGYGNTKYGGIIFFSYCLQHEVCNIL